MTEITHKEFSRRGGISRSVAKLRAIKKNLKQARAAKKKK